MRSVLRLAAILLLSTIPAAVHAQKYAHTSVGPAQAGKQEYIVLEVGQWHVFDFNLSEAFAVEAEALLSTDPAPVYHDLSGKAAVVFGSQEGPDRVQVRVIQKNKTVYRAIVQINRVPLPPRPSPYQARIARAYAAEGSKPADLEAMTRVYTEAKAYLPQAATGKDVWDWLDARYRPFGTVLQGTRREIGTILGETTTDLYKAALTAPQRKLYLQVLSDIETALKTLQASPPGPGPDPGPVGPHQIYMVIIEEATERTPSRAVMLDDDTLAARFKDKGHKYLIIDQNVLSRGGGEVPPKLKPYLDIAKGKQLPYAILVDQKTGVKLTEGPLPATATATLEMLTKAGG